MFFYFLKHDFLNKMKAAFFFLIEFGLGMMPQNLVKKVTLQ